MSPVAVALWWAAGAAVLLVAVVLDPDPRAVVGLTFVCYLVSWAVISAFAFWDRAVEADRALEEWHHKPLGYASPLLVERARREDSR